MVNIISEEDLIEHVNEYDVILVGANIYGHMNGGFQFDVKRRYPYVHLKNISEPYGDTSRLGTIIEAKEDGQPTFCLCYIIEQMNTRPDLEETTISYEHIEKCLKLVKAMYSNKRIASPILGTSKFDGLGDKETVIDIFKSVFDDEDVTLYDYVQESIYSKWRKAYLKGAEIKKNQGVDAWHEYLRQSKNNLTKQNTK